MGLQGSRSIVFVWGAAVAGVGVMAYAIWDVLSRPIATEWLVLLVLTAVSGWATLRIPAMPISFSISDTFSIIAALLVGPSAGAITAALDGLVLSWRMESSVRSVHRVLFNMATPAIATWVAAEAFLWLAGPRPLLDGPLSALRLLAVLAVFGLLVFGLNTGLVAVAISLERRASIVSIWRQHFAALWVTYLGGVFAAMLMMFLRRESPLEALILLAPLPVLLYVTFRHALGRAEDQINHLGKMNKVYVAAIEALAQAIDAKDQVTSDHIRRVQDNSISLARKLGLTDDLQIQAIKAASLLHDVGKLAVPEHILNKPGRLTPSEFEIMKRHAPVGADILSVIGFPYPVVPIVRHHHENWNGTGYPDGLSGDQIPIGARILQVVDCFDALTSHRPYRPRMEDADALKILSDRRGVMYDPRVIDAFFELHADQTSQGLLRTSDDPAVANPTAAPATPAMPDAGEDSSRLHLALFYDLGRALGEPLSLAHIGDTLWAHLEEHVPASAFVFFRYDEALDSLVPCYRGGEITIGADARVPLGERLSGWVAANRKAALNSDARLDVDSDLREQTSLRSALSVPVCTGDRCVGVLTFYSSQADGFTERHRRVAEAAGYVAAQAASRLVGRALAT
jgi:putative nucleotidyltransferase with HDIG domain